MDFRRARPLIHSAGAVYSQGPAFFTQGEKTLKKDPEMKAKWHPKRLQNQRKLDPKTKPENMMQFFGKWRQNGVPGGAVRGPRPTLGRPWGVLGRLGAALGGLRVAKNGARRPSKCNPTFCFDFPAVFQWSGGRFRDDFWFENPFPTPLTLWIRTATDRKSIDR